MARIPLVVSIECDVDGCEEGFIVHGRGEGIGLKRLKSHLEQEGWTSEANPDTGLEDDICPACTRRREVKEKMRHGQPNQAGARADH